MYNFIFMYTYVVQLLRRVRLFATPRMVAYQAPLSMGFSRQKYWSGLPFPSPADLSNPGTKPGSPALQTDALPSEPPGKPCGTKLKTGEMEYCESFYRILAFSCLITLLKRHAFTATYEFIQNHSMYIKLHKLLCGYKYGCNSIQKCCCFSPT